MRRFLAAVVFASTLGVPGLLGAQAPPAVAAPPVAGRVALEWARIPMGTFEIGCVPGDERCGADEHPRHGVTLSKPFDLMATEVTVGLYRASVTEIDPQPAWSLSPDHPVVIVTWDEALAFCRGVGGRLPTEAEWEFAARGGRAGMIFPWGDEPPTDRPGAAGGAAFEGDRAYAVKTFAPNAFGLYDMAGNVWEWVADWGGFYGRGSAIDPDGPTSGRARVVRGGSYGDDAANLRNSTRTPNAPDSANINVGFRCARDVTASL